MKTAGLIPQWSEAGPNSPAYNRAPAESLQSGLGPNTAGHDAPSEKAPFRTGDREAPHL